MATNKGLTINQLFVACQEQITKGNGDKHIQISRDDEGNGFHSLFYAFLDSKEDIKMIFDDGLFESFNIKEEDLDEIVILG